MKMSKLFSGMLAAAVLVQSAIVPTMAAAAPVTSTAPSTSSSTWTPPLSIKEKTPSTNLFTTGDFDDKNAQKCWKGGDQKVALITDENGGYIELSNIVVNYAGFTYTPAGEPIPAGNYKFTGYIRTKNQGAITTLRLFFETAGGNNLIWVSPTDQWMKIETYVTLADTLKDIKICGGTDANYVQSYCVDSFCLENVDSIPANVVTEFGTRVSGTAAKASDNEVPSYDFGGYEVVVKDGVARQADGTICGGMASLWDCVKNMASWGVRLEDAVKMASYNPARQIGLSGSIGSIKEGKDADFVIATNKLDIKDVFIKGRKI